MSRADPGIPGSKRLIEDRSPELDGEALAGAMLIALADEEAVPS